MKKILHFLVLGFACSIAHGAILLSDNFTYSDGVLTNLSSGKWRHTSGGADQVNVASGSVELTRSETEDVAASLATPFSASSPAVLYVKFTVNVSALPQGVNGNYFGHFDGGSARARIFVTTNSAVMPGLPAVAPGKFRFGIGNAGTAPTGVWLSDLNLNETYTIVARLRVSTGLADLFVNPTSEDDLSVPGGDGASGSGMNAWAWRQDTGMGTLTVDDLVVATSFREALLGNETPSIPDIPDQRGVEGTPTIIPFTIGDAESAADSLQVFAAASDTNLVQSISFGGTGSNRSLTITPQAGQTGTVAVTVFVSDSVTTNSDSFALTVVPALLFEDDFNYADGSLLTNSTIWAHHSGSVTGQLQVVSGQAVLTSGQTEDVNVPVPGAPYATNSGVRLYASFRVTFSQLPGSTGDYVVHFNTTSARCRLFVNTANAAARHFRFGIANGANSLSEQLATDLATNVTYRVVLRYDPASAVSTLWVEPADENDPGATAVDAAAPSAINSFALRQDPGIGAFTLDDLRIGLSFAAVTGANVSPAPVLRAERLPGAVRLTWPASATGFVLQSNTNLNFANWEDVMESPANEDGQNVLTNSPAGDIFFRLRK